MCPEALNKGIDQELFEKIISINRVCNYHNMLKIDVAALAPGESSLMIHVEERHINSVIVVDADRKVLGLIDVQDLPGYKLM